MKVEYHKVDYKNFGYVNSEVYNHVLAMTRDYGFWYSGFCSQIKHKDMTEYTISKSKSHSHKFILYNIMNTDTFYLVQYCRTLIKIYYCYDGKYRTIVKNIKKAYNEGCKEYAVKEFRS